MLHVIVPAVQLNPSQTLKDNIEKCPNQRTKCTRIQVWQHQKMNRIQKLDHPFKKKYDSVKYWQTSVYYSRWKIQIIKWIPSLTTFISEKRGRDQQSGGHRLLGTYLSDKRNSSQLQCDYNYITLVNVIEKYTFHKCNHYWKGTVNKTSATQRDNFWGFDFSDIFAWGSKN